MTQGSLFDGFGGLRRGFEDAGFETKWTVDLLNGQDITKLNPADFERVDLISGGPQCQKGSQSATFQKGRTYETGWSHMLRFVKALKPIWVVLENVRGFQRPWARQGSAPRAAYSLGHVPTVCEAEYLQGFRRGELHSWAREMLSRSQPHDTSRKGSKR